MKKAYQNLKTYGLTATLILFILSLAACGKENHTGSTNTVGDLKVVMSHPGSAALSTADNVTFAVTPVMSGNEALFAALPYEYIYIVNCTPGDADALLPDRKTDVFVIPGETVTVNCTFAPKDGGDITIPPEDLHLPTLTADGNTAVGELNGASQTLENDTVSFIADIVDETVLVEDIGAVEAALVTATTAFNALSAALNKAEGRDDIDAAVITNATTAKGALQAAITRAHKALEAARQAIRNAHDPDDPIDPDMNGRVNICPYAYDGTFPSVTVTEVMQGLNEPRQSVGCFTFVGLPKRLDLQFDIAADGYKMFRTAVIKIEGAEVPNLTVFLQPDVALNEGDLYLGTAGIVTFTVFLGDPEPLPLSLSVWQMTNNKLELLAPGSFTCAHEGMVDRVVVPADCSQMTAGSEAGCEVVTLTASGHSVEFHGRAIDSSMGGSPANWDRGPECQ